MNANVGRADRIIRLLLAAVLLSLLVLLDGPARYVGLLGLIPLATGLAGFCPLYRLVGLSTCPLGESGQSESA